VGAAIHCARGRLGHRPVRRVPDREVLAALVPERVLPFASGDSRKRGLSRAEAKTSDAAVGRRKASAPAPFFEVQGGLGPPEWEDRRTDARRIACRCGSCLVRFSALRLPSFKGGGFLGMLSWLGFSWRGKARMRKGIATTERLVSAGLDPPTRAEAFGKRRVWNASAGEGPAIHGVSQGTYWSQLHSAGPHGPPGQARW
jgi:hypothetical protein